MPSLLDHPLAFLPFVVLLMSLAGALGAWLKATRAEALNASSDSLKTLESAVLGLLGLLLGFSFAMGVSRYDTRKQLELEEANAIGTTWLRTGALAEPARTNERRLLQQYVSIRLGFLTAGIDRLAIAQTAQRTGDLQAQLWTIGVADAASHRDSVSALFLASLNDTIDVTEKRTAAFENRIPAAAWVMLLFMACAASALVGSGISSRPLLLVLPLVVGAALTLILDLDSPRAGFVRVQQNSMARAAAQIGAAQP